MYLSEELANYESQKLAAFQLPFLFPPVRTRHSPGKTQKTNNGHFQT